MGARRRTVKLPRRRRCLCGEGAATSRDFVVEGTATGGGSGGAWALTEQGARARRGQEGEGLAARRDLEGEGARREKG